VESCCHAVHTYCHRQSACRAALYQIHKMVTKPQHVRQGFHRHAAPRQHIASSVASSRQPIHWMWHIYTVESHIGTLAMSAPTHLPPAWLKAPERQTCPSTCNRRPSMAWPHHPEVWEPGKDAPSPPKPATGMGALHKTSHGCHELGSSSTAAICFTAAQATAHDVEKSETLTSMHA
jgi:hypothetical protein